MSFDIFIRHMTENLAEQRLKQADVKSLAPGVYRLGMRGHRSFKDGSLIVDGHDIQTMQFNLTVGFKRVRLKIVYGFEVNGRGRCVEFEGVELGRGHSLTNIRVVTLASDEKESG